MVGPPAHLLARQSPPSEDKAERIREALKRVIGLIAERDNLIERLKELEKEITNQLTREIPDLMDEARVDKFGIPPEGNQPGYDAVLIPYYKANIAASWDDERRDRAFSVLKELGLDDLVRNRVSVSFGRGEASSAAALIDTLIELGYEYNQAMDVPWKSLTAAVQNLAETQRLPSSDKLEAIGATVGRSVKLTPRKE